MKNNKDGSSLFLTFNEIIDLILLLKIEIFYEDKFHFFYFDIELVKLLKTVCKPFFILG